MNKGWLHTYVVITNVTWLRFSEKNPIGIGSNRYVVGQPNLSNLTKAVIRSIVREAAMAVR
jgi:hypothetical protein